MYDPSTVAFEIKYPWRKYGRQQRNSNDLGGFLRTYHAPFITIWHEDPENSSGKCGVRGDDTCGWFSPPYTTEDRDRITKLGRSEYSTLFRKQFVLAEGDPERYAYVCYEPSAYDAIYWAWRAIKYQNRKSGWMFGEGKRALTAEELQEIFHLYSNPVDNLRMSFAEVKNEETCGSFFMTVYRCYQRFNRPWYKHPRWHFWHWRFQVHLWQTFRRWAFSRCAGCGKRFPWGYSPVSHQWHSERPKLLQGESGVYHHECSGMTMKLHSEPAKGTA